MGTANMTGSNFYPPASPDARRASWAKKGGFGFEVIYFLLRAMACLEEVLACLEEVLTSLEMLTCPEEVLLGWQGGGDWASL